MKRLFWTSIVLWFAAATVWGQSLAEIARKEKERRKNLEEGASHSYTDVDLRGPQSRLSVPSGQTSSGDESTEAEESAEDEELEEEDPTQTRAYWQERVRSIDQRIRDMEARLQSPEYTANTQGAWERQRLEQDLARARAERGALIEEARRAGVPPGWVR